MNFPDAFQAKSAARYTAPSSALAVFGSIKLSRFVLPDDIVSAGEKEPEEVDWAAPGNDSRSTGGRIIGGSTTGNASRNDEAGDIPGTPG